MDSVCLAGFEDGSLLRRGRLPAFTHHVKELRIKDLHHNLCQPREDLHTLLVEGFSEEFRVNDLHRNLCQPLEALKKLPVLGFSEASHLGSAAESGGLRTCRYRTRLPSPHHEEAFKAGDAMCQIVSQELPGREREHFIPEEAVYTSPENDQVHPKFHDIEALSRTEIQYTRRKVVKMKTKPLPVPATSSTNEERHHSGSPPAVLDDPDIQLFPTMLPPQCKDLLESIYNTPGGTSYPTDAKDDDGQIERPGVPGPEIDYSEPLDLPVSTGTEPTMGRFQTPKSILKISYAPGCFEKTRSSNESHATVHWNISSPSTERNSASVERKSQTSLARASCTKARIHYVAAAHRKGLSSDKKSTDYRKTMADSNISIPARNGYCTADLRTSVSEQEKMTAADKRKLATTTSSEKKATMADHRIAGTKIKVANAKCGTALKKSLSNHNKQGRKNVRVDRMPSGKGRKRGPYSILNSGYISEDIGEEKVDVRRQDDVLPCFSQLMTDSHVTRGFWLTIPRSFSQDHLPDKDTCIVLQDSKGFKWDTNFLYYRSGLSGGWRRFVFDHGLECGDMLRFELVKPLRLKVDIEKGVKRCTEDCRSPSHSQVNFSEVQKHRVNSKMSPFAGSSKSVINSPGENKNSTPLRPLQTGRSPYPHSPTHPGNVQKQRVHRDLGSVAESSWKDLKYSSDSERKNFTLFPSVKTGMKRIGKDNIEGKKRFKKPAMESTWYHSHAMEGPSTFSTTANNSKQSLYSGRCDDEDPAHVIQTSRTRMDKDECIRNDSKASWSSRENGKKFKARKYYKESFATGCPRGSEKWAFSDKKAKKAKRLLDPGQQVYSRDNNQTQALLAIEAKDGATNQQHNFVHNIKPIAEKRPSNFEPEDYERFRFVPSNRKSKQQTSRHFGCYYKRQGPHAAADNKEIEANGVGRTRVETVDTIDA